MTPPRRPRRRRRPSTRCGADDSPQPLAEKTIAEHAAELELEPWQLQALLARLAGKGLDLHSTISKDTLEAELTKTLRGRI